jgi:ABC-type branched-subunit amino acid transport system ATPase component
VTPAAPLLIVETISAGYGRLDILHGVSLTIHANEIVSIIGPNGAGKSTAFKAIVGFLHPREGRGDAAGRLHADGGRQNAARALAVADRGYVLELGRNRFEGAGPQLLADPEVKRLYLGG